MTADLADGTWYLDTEYQGATRLIATAVLESDLGLLLVDPGPTSCLDTLLARLDERGYDLDDVHALLLTHIHLDHAGAAGTLAQAAPHVEVYVHERGAPHLVRPARLLKSARRIYGDAMDRLWGAFEAVPEARVHALEGGETLALGGCTLEVAYTPGHAKHHVSYFDRESGIAYVGDVGGMRVTGADFVAPVAPPPDIDLEAWHASLDTVRAWTPEHLFLTHFGPSGDPARHLDLVGARLDVWADEVRQMVAHHAPNDADADDALATRFHEAKLATLRAVLPEADYPPYEQFAQPHESWTGLARYWRKRQR
jgi:glyoxylase-like metal-dependent hydrolase (beta-lactamase superfamily II)